MTVREHDSVMFGLKRKYFWLSFWCGHLKPHFIRLMEKTVVLFFQSITEFVFIWLQSELHNCLNDNFHDENKFKICCFAHNLFVVFFLSFLCIVEIRFEFHSMFWFILTIFMHDKNVCDSVTFAYWNIWPMHTGKCIYGESHGVQLASLVPNHLCPHMHMYLA